MPTRYWSQREIALLRKVYLRASVKDLEKTFNRSMGAIRKKARALQVPRRPLRYEYLAEGRWMPALSAAEIGYLAGLIDGEGTITIHNDLPTGRTKPRYGVKVCISGTDQNFAKWLSQLGVKVFTRNTRKNPRWKKTWQTGWHGYRTLPVLKLVRPYLVVKAKQADIALQYLEMRLQEKTYNAPYSQKYHLLHKRIRRLNRRGLSASRQASAATQ